MMNSSYNPAPASLSQQTSTERQLIVQEPLTAVPVLFLWVHANCNCRCVMCDIWQLRSRTEITADDLRRWKDDWIALGVQHVILTGGEALMHSHLWDLCAILRSSGINITLLSTGLTLGHYVDKVVEYISRVNVSLAGPPEVHDSIRRIPGACRKLSNSVMRLKAIQPSFPVFARSAIHRRNCDRLRSLVQTAHDAGLDGVSFLATDVTSEAFNRPGGWSAERANDLALGLDDLPRLEAKLEALTTDRASDFETGYINESPTVLKRRLLNYYEAHLGLASFPSPTCNAPWASAVIEYDGTVRPCFFQPVYGNIHEVGSLSAIIDSAVAKNFRRSFNVATNPICRRCVCPIAVYRCECGASRRPPYCDNTCDLLALINTGILGRS
jgi:MoaA/NifB/PqqE/SkfB family radical SAM enzyme